MWPKFKTQSQVDVWDMDTYKGIGKYGQGTDCTKMSADSSAKITPNAPKFICQICEPKP